MSFGLEFLRFAENAKFDTWYAFGLAFLKTFQIDKDGPFLIDKIETLPAWYFREHYAVTKSGPFRLVFFETLPC